MRELQIFTNKKVGQMRGYIDASNTIHFNVEDSVKGLGFMTYGKNGETRIMWNIVRNLLKSFDYTKKVKASDYIPENIFYMLAMRADNPYAINFQKWIGNEVIPSIRKTGSYSVGQQIDNRTALTRIGGKHTRNKETSAIQLFVNYAASQGDTREPGKIYANFSILANQAAGIPNGGRDGANYRQLNICELVENIIRQVLIRSMAAGKHYAQIESEVITKVDEFTRITFSSVPLLN